MSTTAKQQSLRTEIAAIPYGRQDISPADIESVVATLRSDWLTQGPAIPAFENAVACYVGARHAIATCNATAALHIACVAMELGPGNFLWTTPNTFVASANCGLYCGADVDFVDIAPDTYNLSVEALECKLAASEREGKLPKIVVPVDFSGQPYDHRAVKSLADRYGFRIIEDASHAIGGTCYGEKIGSGRYSDITVFSFHPVKIITTGEGGMALTNDADLGRRLAMLRTHGITRDPSFLTNASEGDWYYEQLELGFNYRMTDMQAALGRAQLMRIDQFIRRRSQLAERYNQAFRTAPLITPVQSEFGQSAWHLYVIRLDDQKTSLTRRQVFDALRARGILVNVHYIPVHLQPYYRAKFGFKEGDFPIAEKYYSSCISLPMYAALTDEQQDRVIEAVLEVVGRG